jgi:hypothetical protein
MQQQLPAGSIKLFLIKFVNHRKNDNTPDRIEKDEID